MDENALLDILSSSLNGCDSISSIIKALYSLVNNNEKIQSNNSIPVIIHMYIIKSIGNLLKRSLTDYFIDMFIETEETSLQYIQVINSYFGWSSLYTKYFTEAFHAIINKEVVDLCQSDEASEYSTNIFDTLVIWCNDKLLPFVDQILSSDFNLVLSSSTEDKSYLFFNRKVDTLSIRNEISSYLVDSFTKNRANSLFEMIRDYPDSLVAIKELKSTTIRSNNMGYIGKVFRKTIQKRLLHMGASTSQILDFYISMINVLRVIDPSDLLLNYVAVPVRQYLKVYYFFIMVTIVLS